MLIELRVENYAVIDSVVVEFAPGLNLLTGETGAGKSILIDALALLMGEKASSDLVRHGADKAVIAAVFESDGELVNGILETNGLDANGSEVILRREIAAGGKGRVFINNQPAAVQVLKQLAPALTAIHAQNESILSFDASSRLALLDDYAGVDRRATADAFAKWSSIRMRIAELERDEQDRLRLLDLWSFQKDEIEGANLQPEEDQKLEAERRVLANSEKIFGAAMGAYDQLYEGESSVAAALRVACRQVEELARFDQSFNELKAGLESARITVEDAGITLRDYADRIDTSPERLAQVEDRLAAVERLKRKYGPTLDQVIAYGAEVSRKLAEMENKDEILKHLRADLAEAAAEYLAAARDLSRQRFAAARKLEKIVEAEINGLAMKARFKIEITGSDDQANWTATGFDVVQYLISANPGEPLGPVEHIASGGELSRVMLALKSVVAQGSGPGNRGRKNGSIKTLVFDEIDTGISGRAAEAVGRKLKSLAKSNQVLCVTHLPQIASFADHHYLIDKKESGGRTRTSVHLLDGKARTEEVARMLSGAKLTEASLKNAEAMIGAAGA
jgi:DNA repair protein RecN (Recombination protein N)